VTELLTQLPQYDT